MHEPAPRITSYTASDGYQCATRVWDADRPKARLVLLHGIVSHGGWYEASCGYLARLGLEVHFMERRGSGLNAAARGDVDFHETWLDDVERYRASLTAKEGGEGIPTLLAGISWGGKLAAALAARRPPWLAGVALICPGIYARQFPSRLKYAVAGIARRVGAGRMRVAIPLADPALFTDSPEWQSTLLRDPLNLWKVTLRFALADRELTREACAAAPAIAVPTLVLLAGRDRIVDNRSTRKFYERLATPDRRIVEYPAAAHTLEFEPEPHDYFSDFGDWALTVAGSMGTFSPG